MNKPTYVDFDHDKFVQKIKYYDLRGEMGVLSYNFSKYLSKKWRFRTPILAKKSAKHIYDCFSILIDKSYNHKSLDRKFFKFMKADLCRKFLMMGFTRSMRYYYHKNGKKWKKINGQWKKLPFDYDPEKKISAQIFKEYLQMALDNELYKKLRTEFVKLSKEYKYYLIDHYDL